MKKKCHSLKEVRKNIDRIDRKLVPLIGSPPIPIHVD